MSRQSVSKWENGKNFPSIEIIIDLSDLLEISIDELLKSDEDLKDKVIQDSKEATGSPWLSSILFLGGVLLGIILVSLLKNGEINWSVLGYALVLCLSLWLISKGKKKVTSEPN